MWGPWTATWGFWWVFPLLGMLLCFAFMLIAVRVLGAGHGVMCMGRGHSRGDDGEAADMRREIAALRLEVERLKMRAPGV